MNRTLLAVLLSSALMPAAGFCLTQDAMAPAADPQAPSTDSAPAAVSSADEPLEAAEVAPASPEQALRDAVLAETQPPDGEWLLDAEGRQYFLRKHPKHRAYRIIDNSRVRVIYGGEYELAGEDAENLWLKVYRPSVNVADRTPV